MEFTEYKQLLIKVADGKHLPDSIYLHASALGAAPIQLADVALKIADALKIEESAWNVLKFAKRDFKISFLSYPDFDSYPYPALSRSFTVDLSKLSMREANYSESENPPILHRRESFVLEQYPLHDEFASFTKEGEQIGLYEETSRIGFQKNWLKLIRSKGYSLDESGRLIPLFDKDSVEPVDLVDVERHRTAIDRNQLSQPMQILARHGYLVGQYTVLDYGCGKGDDVRELEAHGIDVVGWDPNFYPENEVQSSDITNVGFVLNVIEERDERDETLRKAWTLTEKILVVSVMVAGEATIAQFKPYKDGVVTKSNTFQKYYAQSEIKLYIETVLEEEAIAVGQGIFFIFRDKVEEQEFLLERQHVRRSWSYRTKSAPKSKGRKLSASLFDSNKEIFEDFWRTSLDLGRVPANSEFEYSDQLRRIAGSHMKAHEFLLAHYGEEEYELSKQQRREDLLVYFSLGLFSKRKPYSRMPEGLKRDIKAFFKSHRLAIDEASELLFSVGSNEVINRTCENSYQRIKCGVMDADHSFTFHKEYLPEVEAPLRIYVGCALALYGELEDVDLIKAHMTSGKVTFLEYDNWESETPHLRYRVKVRLRDQEVDFFDHGRQQQSVDKRTFN
jgi:DNA phosphorothioation-associated putative methyltransferase